jgi:hypothetical protein
VTDDVGILSRDKFDAVIIHDSGCSTQDEALSQLAAHRVISPVVFLIIMPSDRFTALAGLELAAVVGCSTKADWAHARRHGIDESRLAQISHGVDAKSVSGSAGFRKRHTIPPACKLFVSAGGFAEHKRMLELARVFERARRPMDVLVLFGYQPHPDGDAYLDRCRAIGGVKVMLFMPRQEVLDALVEADLYVMHSSYEGFGLVLLEAMLNGCPWAANSAAGAASDLSRFGRVYSRDDELVAILKAAKPLQPVRRAALREAALARHTVQTSIDDLQRALVRREGGSVFGPAPPPMQPVDDPPLIPADAAAAHRACYAAFLHGKDGYHLGVLALKKSLDAAGCALPLIVAITSSVPHEHRARLEAAGCELRVVELLSIGTATSYGALRKEFVTCFAKLWIW